MALAKQRAPMPVRNPRNGEIDCHITPASADEIAETCARLRKAQPAWGAAAVEHRIVVMRKWAERIKTHRAALVEADLSTRATARSRG